MHIHFFSIAGLCLLLLLGCDNKRENSNPDSPNTQIAPVPTPTPQPTVVPGSTPPVILTESFISIHDGIFVPRCLNCHSTGHSGQRVPLSNRSDLLDSPRDLVLPGNPDESGLILALTRTDDKQMPPKESGFSRLTQSEIETIRSWIIKGAL